jgi:hypothetical protein
MRSSYRAAFRQKVEQSPRSCGNPMPETSRLHETASFGPPVEEEHLYKIVDILDAVAEETGETVLHIRRHQLTWGVRVQGISDLLIRPGEVSMRRT